MNILSANAIRELILTEEDRLASLGLTQRERTILKALFDNQDPMTPTQLNKLDLAVTGESVVLSTLWKKGYLERTSAGIIGSKGYVYYLTEPTRKAMEGAYGIQSNN